jgi:hypothetical protein
MRDRTPKMLTFPDLGSQVEAPSELTQRLRMSVEQHTVPGNLKQVNTFYVSLLVRVERRLLSVAFDLDFDLAFHTSGPHHR